MKTCRLVFVTLLQHSHHMNMALQVQKLLSENKAKLHVTDIVGRNVLQYAALAGNLALVTILASAPYTIELDRSVYKTLVVDNHVFLNVVLMHFGMFLPLHASTTRLLKSRQQRATSHTPGICTFADKRQRVFLCVHISCWYGVA